MSRNILFILGTRPEAIKLAPLIHLFKDSDEFTATVCLTGQHKELINDVLPFFGIEPDLRLSIMKEDQSLAELTRRAISALNPILQRTRPLLVIVQGDTTTSFVASLTAFYNRIPVAHIEAGLRSFNKFAPFPEEMNRVLISHLADYHFAPTNRAKENLLREGITKNVWVVGNTVVDALMIAVRKIRSSEEEYLEKFSFLDLSRKLILVTTHRRESFGEPLVEICSALKEISYSFKDVEIILPVHPNPNVRNSVISHLKGIERIHLVDPLPYPDLVWIMSRSFLILTDSGGIQEEAPSLGVPVLVMREVTERIEGLDSGNAILVGTSKKRILEEAANLISNDEIYNKLSKANNPYGDGKSSRRIYNIISEVFP